MNGDHPNAVAGPSTLPPLVFHQSPPPQNSPLSDPVPLLYLPPPVPPPPRQHLAATQDLLARFHLLPAYDRYVRPFVLPGDDAANQPPHSQGPSDGAGATMPGNGPDKGKARAREATGGSAAADVDHADAGDADDDDAPGAKGEKKKKNSYKHLIKGVPGKHSLKKDDYLTTMMLVPPKQRMRIHQFDAKTREDAFTVSLEGLKGWNANTLILESAQAREDRKKRKELKRLAKMGVLPAQTGATPVGTPQVPSAAPLVAQPQPVHAAPGTVPNRKMTGGGTPKPSVGTPRPSSRVANATPSASGTATPSAPAHAGPAAGNATRTAVPRPRSAVPRPGSTVPRPGSAVSAAKAGTGPPPQRTGTPVVARPGTPMDVDQAQRGKKRERDEIQQNGVQNGGTQAYPHGHNSNGVQNGNGYANGVPNGALPPRPGLLNAKAGTGNIRPRKKQRLDIPTQARDPSQPVQQQPTPQGV